MSLTLSIIRPQILTNSGINTISPYFSLTAGFAADDLAHIISLKKNLLTMRINLNYQRHFLLILSSPIISDGQ